MEGIGPREGGRRQSWGSWCPADSSKQFSGCGLFHLWFQTFPEDYEDYENSLGFLKPAEWEKEDLLWAESIVKQTNFYWYLLCIRPGGRHGMKEDIAWLILAIRALKLLKEMSPGTISPNWCNIRISGIQGTYWVNGSGRDWCSLGRFGDSTSEKVANAYQMETCSRNSTEHLKLRVSEVLSGSLERWTELNDRQYIKYAKIVWAKAGRWKIQNVACTTQNTINLIKFALMMSSKQQFSLLNSSCIFSRWL